MSTTEIIGKHDVLCSSLNFATPEGTVKCDCNLSVMAELLGALELAYVALLKSGTSYRIHIQPELCACRDALANATGRTDEDTQNHYEEVALKQQLATKGKP